MVMFVMPFNVILTFESVGKILKCDYSKLKVTEQYFPVVLVFMLLK